MEDGQAIHDQRKGLLQLDLLGRRADRQALLQPGSKLRVVRPPWSGVPQKFMPKEDRILEEIVRSSARRRKSPAPPCRLDLATLLPEALADSGPGERDRGGTRPATARSSATAPGRVTPAASSLIPHPVRLKSCHRPQGFPGKLGQVVRRIRFSSTPSSRRVFWAGSLMSAKMSLNHLSWAC
jgi:hypothetical protein